MAPKKMKSITHLAGEDGAVLKKPAAALMKRPAAADAADGEEEDHAIESEVMKRPAAAGDSNADEAVAEETEEGPSDTQLARSAVNNVRKQQRLIDRLNADNEKLAQRMKANKSALRKAEAEQEELKKTATKFARKLGVRRSAVLRKKMEGKKMRAQAKGERAEAMFKKARKFVTKMQKRVNEVKEKSDFAEQNYRRAEKAYQDAKKKCKQLKDEGEEVPDEGEKDLSAPGAYKPPGIRAAKERDFLKASLAPLKAKWEKAKAITDVKLQRQNTLKEKMNNAKRLREEAEEEENSVVKKRPAAK